ncbi:hypothetical protein DFJ74DRAFT_709376 [Hyaloraphidium curvatum]|nr:hypothetical protein DFJ74DRAFT_709376 [Hyaloraphidium curvatum]
MSHSALSDFSRFPLAGLGRLRAVDARLVTGQGRLQSGGPSKNIAEQATKKMGEGAGDEIGNELRKKTKEAGEKVSEAIGTASRKMSDTAEAFTDTTRGFTDRPNDPPASSKNVAGEAKDLYEMTSDFTKEAYEKAKDMAIGAASAIGIKSKRGIEDAPVRSGEVGEIVKDKSDKVAGQTRDPKASGDPGASGPTQ